MGLEALSRNADEVIMVEKSPKAAAVIASNLKTCHFETERPKFCRPMSLGPSMIYPIRKKTFDLIYLDPPYTVDEIFEPVMDSMGKANLLDPDGMLVIRTRKEKR